MAVDRKGTWGRRFTVCHNKTGVGLCSEARKRSKLLNDLSRVSWTLDFNIIFVMTLHNVFSQLKLHSFYLLCLSFSLFPGLSLSPSFPLSCCSPLPSLSTSISLLEHGSCLSCDVCAGYGRMANRWGKLATQYERSIGCRCCLITICLILPPLIPARTQHTHTLQWTCWVSLLIPIPQDWHHTHIP